MCHIRCPHENRDGQCKLRYLPPDCPMAMAMEPPNEEDCDDEEWIQRREEKEYDS